MKGFKPEELRLKMIYYYDFVAILETIFYNVFDRLGNRISTVADGINGPISTNAIFVEALYFLSRCLS